MSFSSKTNVNTTKYPGLVPRVFPFVCQTIMGEPHNNDYQYKTSMKVYGEKLMIYKNFFKVAGKPKMLANMPNGIAGRNFGQGLPPVKVTLKKWAEMAKTRTWNSKNWQKNMNSSLSFCSKKTPDHWKHAYGSVEQNLTPLKQRSRQPRKS